MFRGTCSVFYDNLDVPLLGIPGPRLQQHNYYAKGTKATKCGESLEPFLHLSLFYRVRDDNRTTCRCGFVQYQGLTDCGHLMCVSTHFAKNL